MSNLHRILKWRGYDISLHRYGEQGMWGVDRENLLGKTFYNRLLPYLAQYRNGFRYWAQTVTNARLETGTYTYFKDRESLLKTFPNAIEFDGAGHRWSLADAIRRETQESVIGTSPTDQ